MRITILMLLTLFACKGYEESFNRNLNNTAGYVVNSTDNTVSQYSLDYKSYALTASGALATGTTPIYINTNPASTFAYVVNSGSNDVSIYSINKSNRKLTLIGSATTGTTPQMILFNSTGTFAYVPNKGSTDITIFSVNATTGTLTQVTGSPIGTGGGTATGPIGIVIIGSNAYVANAGGVPNVTIHTVDPATGLLGAATGTAATTGLPRFATTNPSGSHLYVLNANGSIDYSSGVAFTNVPTTGVTPSGMVFNAAGTVAYVTNSGSNDVSIFSITSGVPTFVVQVTVCTTPEEIVMNSAGYAYIVCSGSNNVQLYSTTSTGMTLTGDYPTGNTPKGFAGY